ncbi:hypothetical protein HanIR_Chr13g0626211 [Helianthus annuus]|nr:hypothetical protein HanIR_Chr13g0626211 [Helianthus annuus]
MNRSIERLEKVGTLQCSQILQQELQKFKSSNTNTPEEETIHLNGPADRANRPVEQDCPTGYTSRSNRPSDRTCRSIDQPIRSIHTCLLFRITHRYAIELFRLIILSALPSIRNQSL